MIPALPEETTVPAKTNELTETQWAEVHRLRGEWLAAGTCCEPADRAASEAAITEMYRLTGRPAPQFVWVDSPATASLAIWLLSGKAGDSLRASLGDSLRASLRDSLRDSLWDSLGDSLWDSLRDSLWASLGDSLGDSLRASLGDSLGDSLRASLRDSLWDSLGDSLRDSLGDSLYQRFWGQHEAHWIAFYDVPRHLGLVTYSDEVSARLDLWTALARSCGWWWPYGNVCVISERPALVKTETWDAARGTVRLHSASGPAMRFRDGWPVYAWRGRQVPAWVVEEPTVERIAGEGNVEVRRCAIESLGWEKFTGQLLAEQRPAVAPDPGNPGQDLFLYEVPERLWGTRVKLLLCTNGSAERDGARRRYGLTVPVHIKDPVEAAAWTAGLTKSEYALMQRRT
jgi:hypothetical protein